MARTFEDVDTSPNPPQYPTLVHQVARLVRNRLRLTPATRRKHNLSTTATPPPVLVEQHQLHQLDQRRPVQPPSRQHTRPKVCRRTSRTRHRVQTLWATLPFLHWLPTPSPYAHLTPVSALPLQQHNTLMSQQSRAAVSHQQHLHQAPMFKRHETFAYSGTSKGIQQMFKHSALITTLWYVFLTRLSSVESY